MKSLFFIAILSLLLVGVFMSAQRSSDALKKREAEKASQQTTSEELKSIKE